MYNDIIDAEDITCGECWWSIEQGHNPTAETGKIYCNLNKRDYRKEYSCGSWRQRQTRETPKLKINIKWVCPNCGAGYNHKVDYCVACWSPI